MKAFRIALGMATLTALFFYSGCGSSKPAETIQDKNLGLMSKIWKVSTVSDNGVDSTAHWTNFTLQIKGDKTSTSYSYICDKRPKVSVWPSQGTWSFNTASPGTAIIRDPGTNDELAVGYTIDAAGKNLQLSFTFNNPNGGYTRVENVSGQWVFNLIPQ
ncbi:MAG: hypothetical protein JST48_08415 [Bacteroidetes bacterium]|nr:hypothetical protein [Bacteroidota bacterium]